ncbi:MAG TPA: DUF3418 domain-containing protein, partial [Gammaproteobacteria bacterium]|nr:DUF3418 domain-containing protein [Gammaproteobacteria bacterium]
LAAVGDVRSQLDHLVYPGFVTATPLDWLPHLPRYLKGIRLRLDRLEQNPPRDRQPAALIEPLWRRYLERVPGPGEAPAPALSDYRWMLEEYRVSLFAQELKTAVPVSAKRMEALWRAVTEER